LKLFSQLAARSSQLFSRSYLCFMSKKEKILFGLVLFFLTTLYLPWLPVLSVAAAASLVAGAIAFSPFSEKKQLFRERKYVWGMVLFFAMIVTSVLLSENFDKGLRYLDPRLPLLIFPLSIGTLNLRKDFRDKTLLAFAFLTTAMSMLCLGWGLKRSELFTKPEFLYNDALTEILGQQSIYISLLVNLSIYIFVYYLAYKPFRHKWLLVLATLFLFGISYLLASRVMMGMLYAFAIGFALFYIFRRKKYLEGVTLLMGLLIGVFLIFKFFPKTLNRFKELTYTEFSYTHMGRESHYNMEVSQDQWNGSNFRLAAWRCGWELFQKSPLIGVDIGDKREELFKVYEQKNFRFALETGKNVHNNYLDILYSMGLIGIGLFLLGWIVLPLAAAGRMQDGLVILSLLTFMAAWVTEIYFDRSLGGMLTGFFFPFLLAGMSLPEGKEIVQDDEDPAPEGYEL
jgi:O-antigen ligase